MFDSPTPRTNTEFFGHKDAETAFLRDMESSRLAHGWLLTGPRGIGKATLAYRFARRLLGEEGGRRIAAGSHADLLVIEPRYDEKKEEYARDISVDQAREIGQFLSLTPGESDWRVVIVDPVDALGNAAANAILKILEEPPPQAVLLLVSHNPGKLLPTIRSRCRSLRLASLAPAEFDQTLRLILPESEDKELQALGELSGYSPGIALEMREEGALELYAELLALLTPLPEINLLKIHAFSERVGSGRVHAQWQLLTRLMLLLFERITKIAAGVGVQAISYEEGAALEKLARLHPAAVWAAKWQHCAEQFSLAERLHLDYKQVIIAFIHSIAGTEAFNIGTAA